MKDLMQQALIPAQYSGDQGRILVVDDLPGNVRLLTGILNVAGFQAVTAHSGEEALCQAQKNPPDAVLLDLMMPGMDGFEVCRRLKSLPGNSLLPVVMVTALQDKLCRIQALEAGADDFLSKPVDEVEVVARLKSLVRIKRQHDNLERAYHDLRRAEEMRDSMMAMLVHDLRTPLTTLLVSLDLLHGGQAGELSESQQDLLKISRRGGHQLINQVNQLLDLHKMESGQFHLKHSAVALPELVQEVLEKIEPLASNEHVTIVARLAPHLPPALIDQDLIGRVLLNLLGNAIRFSPKGKIIITVEAQAPPKAQSKKRNNGNRLLLFSVRDNGPGTPPEAHQTIFEKFGQVHPDQTDRRHSTGIGLAFCKFAVELHGGQIWVESVVGHGSTFSFTIPASDAPAT